MTNFCRFATDAGSGGGRRRPLTRSLGQFPSRFRQSDGRGRPSHIVARASPPAEGRRTRRYPFSVSNAFSIRWYHEIIRKYAEGVRGLKPKVERKRNPGYEIQGRSALRAADVNRPLHERGLGEPCSKTREHRGSNLYPSRADRLNTP